MKFTLSWLKEHLDTDEPLDKLAEKLTMIGLEVENIEDKAKALKPFTIAKVISAEQHPNADRLRVCMVDTGDGGAPVQVVCGAPNARAGLVSVFSPPGTYIPGKDITLGVGTIRGVESRGMLCSAAELQISNDHDGIMELPADAPIGAAYAAWAGLGDPVVEINLTPNRQDCTGVHGIARDLAAADMGKFKDPTIKPIKGEFPCPVKVTVEDAALCPGFALRLVRGREERAVAGMAAEATDRDRAAPDQRAGRHHQLHDLRPRTAIARVRREESEGQSRGAPRPRRRDAARA
ncbi:tRNA-binding EMAP/Myf-like protein [Bradyrhizobium sp. GM5.1]